MAAANARSGQDKRKENRRFQLKKEADTLDAASVFFNDDNDENRLYRTALKQKRLRKLLQ